MAAFDRILVFAKVPEPGRVKTRLAPRVGEQGACELQGAFVSDLVGRLRAEPALPALTVYHDPENPGPALRELGARLRPQGPGDLGARMRRALQAEQDEGAQRVVLLGADSPDLPVARLVDAFRALEGAPVVLGPSVDGGYYLLGARGVPEALLAGIPWGTRGVLRATLERARRSGTATALLEPWYDVDHPRDLEFLHTHLEYLLRAHGEDRCPQTRAALSRLLGAARRGT